MSDIPWTEQEREEELPVASAAMPAIAIEPTETDPTEPKQREGGTAGVLPTAAPTLNPTMGTLVALGITLDATTACLLENVSGIYRLIGWAKQPRKAGVSLIHDAATVCRQLGVQLDRALWDEDQNRPFLQSPEPILYPPIEHFAIGVSPRPRMRVQLLGLSPQSINAARQTLVAAPLYLSGITEYDCTLTSGLLATQLTDQQPEALVIVGGYDDPDPATHRRLLNLCWLAGQALSRLSPGERPTVYYAGNRWVAEEVEALLQPREGPIALQRLNNVLPHPGHVVYTELPVALSQLYWQLCQRMPGFAQLSRWVTAPGHVANIESSFAQLVQIWMEYQGLARLHGLYCTDHWWLHVWADAATDGIQLRFVKPNSRPHGFHNWPPLQLVCGPWPRDLWPLASHTWWDRHGFAPLITTIGQVAPQAMLQALEEDVIETHHLGRVKA